MSKAIDPVYAQTLDKAMNAGVEVIAMQALVTPEEIKLVKRIPLV